MAWATKLVGRGAELAELRRELQRVKAGEFRIVLLVGDPGIGKTRLAREILARSHDRVVGLSARAYPLGETASFGLWSEALDSHLRGLAPDEITELCGGFLDGLSALLRSVAAVFDLCMPKPFVVHQAMLDPVLPHGWWYYFRSCDTAELTDDVIDITVEHALQIESPLSVIAIFQLGGAVARVREDETAFAGRAAGHSSTSAESLSPATASKRSGSGRGASGRRSSHTTPASTSTSS